MLYTFDHWPLIPQLNKSFQLMEISFLGSPPSTNYILINVLMYRIYAKIFSYKYRYKLFKVVNMAWDTFESINIK